MLGFLLWGGGIAVLTTAGAVLFGSTQRRNKTRYWVGQQLRKVRARRWEATKTETTRAVRARRDRVAATPRGKLRARRREQPLRMTVGRVRTADDPTVARKVARKTKTGATSLWEKAKVAYANRKAARRPKAKPVLELMSATKHPVPGSHECGAQIERSRGRTATCSRIVATPGERCWQHGGKRAA